MLAVSYNSSVWRRHLAKGIDCFFCPLFLNNADDRIEDNNNENDDGLNEITFALNEACCKRNYAGYEKNDYTKIFELSKKLFNNGSLFLCLKSIRS